MMTKKSIPVPRFCKLYVGCLLWLFSLNMQAQIGASIVDNAIDNSRNLSIGGTIIGADIYDPNLNFFIEGKLAYRFQKELGWIKAHYTRAYLDRIEEVLEPTSYEALPAEGTQPLQNFGGSVGFNFKRKTVVMIARASFFNKLESITLPIKSYRLYGVHVGYENFRSILAQGSTISFTGTVSRDLQRDTVLVASHATPMFRMSMLSFGIHRQLIDHYEISVNDGSNATTFKNRTSSMVYVDFLFGMNMMFDDILIPLGRGGPNSNPDPNANSGGSDPFNFYRADINNSYKKIPFGGRFGWEMTSLQAVGYSLGIEMGFRPGILDPLSNLYIAMRVGISFNARAK
jgi:hypothetical protein